MVDDSLRIERLEIEQSNDNLNKDSIEESLAKRLKD